MTTIVWAAVLGAALLHALWNSLVKSAGDKVMSSARVCLWTGLVAVIVALATPRPEWASAPYVVASAVIHVGYFLLGFVGLEIEVFSHLLLGWFWSHSFNF